MAAHVPAQAPRVFFTVSLQIRIGGYSIMMPDSSGILNGKSPQHTPAARQRRHRDSAALGSVPGGRRRQLQTPGGAVDGHPAGESADIGRASRLTDGFGGAPQ